MNELDLVLDEYWNYIEEALSQMQTTGETQDLLRNLELVISLSEELRDTLVEELAYELEKEFGEIYV